MSAFTGRFTVDSDLTDEYTRTSKFLGRSGDVTAVYRRSLKSDIYDPR
jgi:hypothetical protein